MFGFVPNGAGVIENEVGLVDGFHLAIAFVDERANDLFRVMHIHLAAEGFEVEGFGGGRHWVSIKLLAVGS